MLILPQRNYTLPNRTLKYFIFFLVFIKEIEIECKFTNHTESKLTKNIYRNIDKLQIKGLNKFFMLF